MRAGRMQAVVVVVIAPLSAKQIGRVCLTTAVELDPLFGVFDFPMLPTGGNFMKAYLEQKSPGACVAAQLDCSLSSDMTLLCAGPALLPARL